MLTGSSRPPYPTEPQLKRGVAARAARGRASAGVGRRVLGAALAALGASAAVAAGRAASRRVAVEGPSMLPSLRPGDRLLVRGRRGAATLRPGDLVVVRDPELRSRLLVKRVVAVVPGGVEVRGDNEAESRDSRRFGVVAGADVVGRPWYRYHPTESVGRLRRGGRGT